MSFKGFSGPALQYQHARLASVARHMRESAGLEASADVDVSPLVCDPLALDVVLHLARFDEAIARACSELDPYFVAKYVFDLA